MINKITDTQYIYDDITINKEMCQGKCRWVTDGFLTKEQFKEFLEFVKIIDEKKGKELKVFTPSQGCLSRVGRVLREGLSSNKFLVAGKERIQGKLKLD